MSRRSPWESTQEPLSPFQLDLQGADRKVTLAPKPTDTERDQTTPHHRGAH